MISIQVRLFIQKQPIKAVKFSKKAMFLWNSGHSINSMEKATRLVDEAAYYIAVAIFTTLKKFLCSGFVNVSDVVCGVLHLGFDEAFSPGFNLFITLRQ